MLSSSQYQHIARSRNSSAQIHTSMKPSDESTLDVNPIRRTLQHSMSTTTFPKQSTCQIQHKLYHVKDQDEKAEVDTATPVKCKECKLPVEPQCNDCKRKLDTTGYFVTPMKGKEGRQLHLVDLDVNRSAMATDMCSHCNIVFCKRCMFEAIRVYFRVFEKNPPLRAWKAGDCWLCETKQQKAPHCSTCDAKPQWMYVFDQGRGKSTFMTLVDFSCGMCSTCMPHYGICCALKHIDRIYGPELNILSSYIVT